MFDTSNIFTALFTVPILNVLMGIYNVLLAIRIPGAFGFALILLTALIRLILNPLTSAQMKSTYKLGLLKPELDKLNKLYKDDKKQLQQEQLNLYKKYGINPAAGCLPLLIQMPILISLYNLFFQLLSAKDGSQIVNAINQVVYAPFLKITNLDLSFFGFNLAHKPSDWQKAGFILLLVPVITALLQYVQTKFMMPNTKALGTSQQAIEKKEDKKDEKKGDNEDMAQSMQKQMSIMMPLMIGFFAYSFPLGLSLYWNTFTVFGIIQQHQINKSIKKP